MAALLKEFLHNLKNRFLASIILLALITLPTTSYALTLPRGLTLGVGSVGLGRGGSNGLDPGHPLAYQLSLVTSRHEFLVSLVPGFFYSYRSSLTGFYSTIGAGVFYPVAPAVAAGFGYTYCKIACIGIEYRGAIGYNYLHVLPFVASINSIRITTGVIIKPKSSL